jgi:hypothetical protein
MIGEIKEGDEYDMFYRVINKRFTWDFEQVGIRAAERYAIEMAKQAGGPIYVFVCCKNDPIGLSRGCASPDGGYQTAY